MKDILDISVRDLLDVLDHKLSSSTRDVELLRSEKAKLIKQLLVADSIIHQYETALMNSGVKSEALARLRAQGMKMVDV